MTTADEAFEAWRNSLPATHWSKYDLSACRLGWDAALAARPIGLSVGADRGGVAGANHPISRGETVTIREVSGGGGAGVPMSGESPFRGGGGGAPANDYPSFVWTPELYAVVGRIGLRPNDFNADNLEQLWQALNGSRVAPIVRRIVYDTVSGASWEEP